MHGFGENYAAYFVFHGPLDLRTGMLVNLTTVKQRILKLLAERYDHKFLNVDSPPFEKIPPTPENMARQLLSDAVELFRDLSAHPVICHLEVSPETAATAYEDGRIDRDFWCDFSAARRTYSPFLSDEENAQLFGVSSSPMGHGHNYRLRVTLTGPVAPEDGQIVPIEQSSTTIGKLRAMLDHKNLNAEVPKLAGQPITTESLARFAYEQTGVQLPVSRVRLYETSNFFAEYDSHGQWRLGYELPFNAAHRLHSRQLTNEENLAIYDKCNNSAGHGHRYRVEATIGGQFDERSGTLFNLADLHGRLSNILSQWQFKHLDLEVSNFADKPSTGENIIQELWPRVNSALGNRLIRLRVVETPNNRFTLRAM